MIPEHEFTIKTNKHIDQCFDKIRELGIKWICLTDKKDNLDPFDTASRIRKAFPSTSFSINYSLVNNYSRSRLEIYSKLESFLRKIISFKIDQVLLVSGNPKRKIDSLSALGFIKTSLHLKEIFGNHSKIKLAVAFNPFLDTQEERHRLRLKLTSMLVQKVYFQLGDNLELLKKGIKLVKDVDSSIEIYLSILNPTKAKLENLKFRPWHGVIFSKKFLNNLEFARYQNSLIQDIARESRCGVLVG